MFPEVFRLQKPDVDTEAGYQQTVQLLQEWEVDMAVHRRHFEKMGLTAEELKRAMDPMECFRQDLIWQIETSKQHKPTEPPAAA